VRFLKSSIAARLIWALLCCSLILIILTSAILFYYEYSREIRLLDKRVHEIEESTVPALANSIWLADWEMVRLQAEGIQRMPAIHRVELEVDGREVLAIGGEAYDGASRHTFPLVHKYMGREIPLGSLALYADLNAVRRQLLGEISVELVIRLATILIISFILFFLFHRLAGRHLIALAKQLHGLDQKKLDTPLVLDKKAAVNGEMDELDQVVFSFNELRQNLQRTFVELQQANEELAGENLERSIIEETLGKNRAMLRNIIDTVPQAIFWKDRQGIYLGCNQVFAKAAGLDDPEQIAGKTDFDLPWPKEEAEAYRADDQKVVRLKESKWHVIEPLQQADGTRLWIDTTKVPLLDIEGNVHGVLGVYSDITERLRAEEEKAKLESQLRQAQKMEAIGTLAGGIAHDFNNILSIIFGYSELAMREKDPQKSMPHLEELQKGAARAKELVAQILAFSRKAEQKKQPLQVSLIIKETLKMLRASIPTTIEIKHDIDSDGRVLADPSQMHQLLMNLCTNAYYAMRETGGILAVSLKEVRIAQGEYAYANLTPGNYLQLEVSDTGCGIDPKTLEKIFEPYFTTKKAGDGTGMGLAMVHGIVKSHHGHITVYSEPGKGTSFHVYLPLTEQEAATLPDTTEPKELRGTGERILFVDDEEQIRGVVETILTTNGYQVATFANGVQALEEFQKNPARFNLVITDMTMPYMTGAELAQKILALKPQIPIILCTGQSELINREKALAMGICEYLNKPVPMATLLGAARKALDNTGLPRNYPA